MAKPALTAVALSLAVTACGLRPQAQRVPPKPALAVPYPIGDPIPNPPARNALARNAFVYVAVAGPENPVVQNVPRSRPSATFHLVEATDPRALGLRRLFGKKGPKPGDVLDVRHDDLRSIELGTAAPHVWLIGPDGPCRASIGQPSVGYYDEGVPTYDVGFALEGCDDGAWAQLGSLAPELPAGLRFVAAQTVVSEDLPVGQPWAGPLSDVARRAEIDNPRTDVGESVFVREASELIARPASITHVAYEAEGEPCDASFAFEASYGLWRGGVWESIDPAPDLEAEVPLELLGVFLEDRRIEGMLYHYGEDVVASMAPDGDGPWRAQQILTGFYDAHRWREINFVGRTDACDP